MYVPLQPYGPRVRAQGLTILASRTHHKKVISPRSPLISGGGWPLTNAHLLPGFLTPDGVVGAGGLGTLVSAAGGETCPCQSGQWDQ